MFEFRNGMLGVTIIALAIAGAIVGGYLGGIESVEHDVTKFNYLADVSGLYDYDTNPQYIEYDPSSNYTGYYSTDTYIESMNKYFFAENEVGYTPNQDGDGKTVPNNYRIDLKPDIIAEDAIADLNELVDPVYEEGTYHFRYVYNDAGRNIGWDNPSHPMTLANFLTALEITRENTTSVRITLGNSVNWDTEPTSLDILNLDAVFFIQDKQFNQFGTGKWAYIVNPNVDIKTVQEALGDYLLYYPPQSLEVNLEKNIATLYYNADWTDQIVSGITLSSILVAFGEDQQQGPSNHLNLSDSLTYSQYKEYPANYLNPNYGVSLKDGA